MTAPAPRPSMPNFITPADLKTEYVNLARIAHSPSEIVIDFAQALPGESAPHVVSRIILSPLGAKLLQLALTDNLSRYETAFGEIRLPGDINLAEQLFRPPPSPGEPPSG